jgi:FAD/FMN-containing dehydrogenase/Fe-S oxidoreductase
MTAVRPWPPEEALARDLRALGLRDVRTGRDERMLYATEASPYQVEPIAVVVLDRPEEAVEVMRYCAGRGLPVLPRGGGTSLNGQTVSEAVVLDFSARCRQVLEVDAARKRCRVEPGVVPDTLNAGLAPLGLMFAPDPNTASHSCIGGLVGNNSAGARSIRYGRCVEHVLGLDIALADGTRMRVEEGSCDRDPRQRTIAEALSRAVRPIAGEIRRRFPTIVRHVDGFNLDLLLDGFERSTPGTFDRVNLAKLVCGSEGTLATILGAELNLVEAPRRTGLAMVGFGSVDESLAALGEMLATGPAAVELVDDTILELARGSLEYARYVELVPKAREGGHLGAVMYVEYFARDEAELEERFAELRRRLPGLPVGEHRDAASMRMAWTLRRACEPLLHALPGVRKPIGFVEDTAVDPARLPAFIAEFKRILARHGTHAAFFAHASVGCLHIRPLLALREPRDRATMLAIADEITDLVVREGGALSGEHGSGRSRTHLLERYFGPEVCRALAGVKRIWDPEGRLNPGNKIPGAPRERMVESLRVLPERNRPLEVASPPTRFRYPHEGGFAAAVEACNGAGLCRRLDAGTMCPSYQALLDERHSTRGRANHLRLALSGQLSASGEAEWNRPEVQETLSLCLSCKACKAECPSGVDVGKLKAEYLARGFERSGVPLRVAALGRFRAAAKLASLAPGIVNAVAKSSLGKALARRIAGIDPRRSLPGFARSALAWSRRRQTAAASSAPRVILLADCFTTYGEPAIARAAIETLEAFGYRVDHLDAGCCGRPQLSLGDLDGARTTIGATAARVATALAARGDEAVAIVALEPSCLSALHDEWRELRGGADPEAAARVAANSFLAEDFLERRWEAHPRRPVIRDDHGPSRLLLHAHCHQKALWGAETSAALLRRLLGPGRFTTLATGCCGMAGSFGFDEGKFDLSMAIAERSLLPALRAEPAATACAPGTSCRHQILDGDGRRAIHPIEAVHAIVAGR